MNVDISPYKSFFFIDLCIFIHAKLSACAKLLSCLVSGGTSYGSVWSTAEGGPCRTSTTVSRTGPSRKIYVNTPWGSWEGLFSLRPIPTQVFGIELSAFWNKIG